MATISGITGNHSELKDWVQNYQDNKDLPFLTDSAAISLHQLENFIRDAKEKYSSEFNALKIYFIRYPIESRTPDILKEADKDLSWPSIVIVPIQKADFETWAGNDFKLDNDTIFMLPFCNPRNPPSNIDQTGLCEPKCRK